MPGIQDWLAAGLPVEGTLTTIPTAGEVARDDAPTCRLDERLGDLRDRAREAGWEAAVVVNEQRVVLGLLRAKELDGDPEARIEEAMRPGPSTYRPHVTILEMAELMVRHDLPTSLITRSDGTLVGLLRREDAVEAARRFHERHHHEDHD